jgi:phage tail sheath protein FI
VDFSYKVAGSTTEDNDQSVVIEGFRRTDVADLKREQREQFKAKSALSNIQMLLPASGSSGHHAQVDNSRGVWKAPANINIDNAIRPAILDYP